MDEKKKGTTKRRNGEGRENTREENKTGLAHDF